MSRIGKDVLSMMFYSQAASWIIVRSGLVNLTMCRVFEEVRKEIDSSWEGMNKKIGLALIDQAYLSVRQRNNRSEVIDRHSLLKTGKEFGVKFFELVKKFNESLNDTGGRA